MAYDAPIVRWRSRKGNLLGGKSGAVILVVEDDEDVRALVNATLEDMDYQVISASDGPSALEILRGDRHIDLLFTDVVMPGGMSGLQISILT